MTAEFGGGFSYANLRNFRQFYLTYRDDKICYTLCSKLAWSHNRLIMRVESENARTYYLNEAAEQGWSVRTLERNINTFYYHRLLSSNEKSEDIKYSEVLINQTRNGSRSTQFGFNVIPGFLIDVVCGFIKVILRNFISMSPGKAYDRICIPNEVDLT